jgi:hypothetical protein
MVGKSGLLVGRVVSCQSSNGRKKGTFGGHHYGERVIKESQQCNVRCSCCFPPVSSSGYGYDRISLAVVDSGTAPNRKTRQDSVFDKMKEVEGVLTGDSGLEVIN